MTRSRTIELIEGSCDFGRTFVDAHFNRTRFAQAFAGKKNGS
jgi:hypothetical protein